MGEPTTIIGVAPREFHFAPVGTPEFWVAYQPLGGCDKRRSCHGLYGVARMKDGISLQAALADVTSIAAQLEKEYPDSNRGQGAAIAPLADQGCRPDPPDPAGAARRRRAAAADRECERRGTAVCVRSESRKREIAVRTALGASAGRLIGQFVTEALVLAAGGAVLGLTAAHWADNPRGV